MRRKSINTLTSVLRNSSNINEVIRAVLNFLFFYEKILHSQKEQKEQKAQKTSNTPKAPKALKGTKTSRKKRKKQINESVTIFSFDIF